MSGAYGPERVRAWTDEQDEKAYRVFAAVADADGVDYAAGVMQRYGEKYGWAILDVDVNAWVARYEHE